MALRDESKNGVKKCLDLKVLDRYLILKYIGERVSDNII